MEKYRLIYWKDEEDSSGKYWAHSVEEYSLNDALTRLFNEWFDGSPFSQFYDCEWGPWGLTDWMDVLIVPSNTPDKPLFWASRAIRDRYFPEVRISLGEFLNSRDDIDMEVKKGLLKMWTVLDGL